MPRKLLRARLQARPRSAAEMFAGRKHHRGGSGQPPGRPGLVASHPGLVVILFLVVIRFLPFLPYRDSLDDWQPHYDWQPHHAQHAGQFLTPAPSPAHGVPGLGGRAGQGRRLCMALVEANVLHRWEDGTGGTAACHTAAGAAAAA